jgi:hypothetical protein
MRQPRQEALVRGLPAEPLRPKGPVSRDPRAHLPAPLTRRASGERPARAGEPLDVHKAIRARKSDVEPPGPPNPEGVSRCTAR